jgi:uncharacterized protein YbjQ (UPF0145 family)
MRALVVPVLLLALFPACTPAETMREPALAGTESAVESGASKRPLDAKEAKILVTPDSNLDRHLDVVGVLDFHTKADSEEKGFDELRRKAAELGADAVIGAEFEHGDKGEPSHLSGMAVKYAPDDTRPYDVLGELDIETPEDADDKGFDKLKAKAWAMGADEIRGISFDHGKEGGTSHLRGKAVRHRPK